MKQAERDSAHGAPAHALKALVADNGDGTSTVIEADAEIGSVTISKKDNATGLDVDDAGSINEKLSDVAGSDGNNHDVKLREMSVCVQGSRKLAIFKVSEVYDPAP